MMHVVRKCFDHDGIGVPVGQPSDGVSSKRKAREESPGIPDNASLSGSQSTSEPCQYVNGTPGSGTSAVLIEAAVRVAKGGSKVCEPMPCQLLNAYGTASCGNMEQEKVWEHFNKPEKTGAKYMTGLCSAEGERRGVGISRFLQAIEDFESKVSE